MYIDITSFIIGAIVWEFASYYLIRSIRQFVRGIKRGIADVKTKKGGTNWGILENGHRLYC